MKTKNWYFVETATLDYPQGATVLHNNNEVSKKHTQRWIDTCKTLTEAKATLEQALQDKRAVMAMIVEWQQSETAFFDDNTGEFTGFGFCEVKTGSYAIRHCATGAKILSIPVYFERSFAFEISSTDRTHKAVTVTMGDWNEEKQALKDHDVGGGNWVTFRPTLKHS